MQEKPINFWTEQTRTISNHFNLKYYHVSRKMASNGLQSGFSMLTFLYCREFVKNPNAL